MQEFCLSRNVKNVQTRGDAILSKFPQVTLTAVSALIRIFVSSPADITSNEGGGAMMAAHVLGVTFHYPRLAIMFKSGDVQNADALRRAARQWASGNLVRGVLLLVAFGALLAGKIHLAEHLHA